MNTPQLITKAVVLFTTILHVNCFAQHQPTIHPLTELGIDPPVIAKAAYSLRLLSSFYKGPAVRIKRQSDLAIADVAFDLNTPEKMVTDQSIVTPKKDQPTTTLKDFCAGTDCYVWTWYDQAGTDVSGGGLDAKSIRPKGNNRATFYPKLCIDGKLQKKGSKPVISFDLVDSNLGCFLTTRSFHIGGKNDEGTELNINYSLFIAAGFNKRPESKLAFYKYQTFVSKTAYKPNGRIPNPFDMYNDQYLLGDGHTPPYSPHIYSQGLRRSMDTPKSFGIWSYSLNLKMDVPDGHNKFVGTADVVNVGYFNGILNSSYRGKREFDSHTPKSSPMVIGGRNSGRSQMDPSTLFDGWVGEVILLDTSMTPTQEGNGDLNSSLRKINNNLLTYFDINDNSENYYLNNKNTLNHVGLTKVTSGSKQGKLVGAYSLRKLSDGYFGPAVKISRSYKTHNPNLDIQGDVAFNAFGVVGLQSVVTYVDANKNTIQKYLEDFCKDRKCKVTTWYNQGGDADLNLTGHYPILYQNNKIESINGRPTIRFIPLDKNTPASLKTKKIKVFKLGEPFNVYVAGGVKTDAECGYNTLVSKTVGNMPSPFDMHNGAFLYGNGNLEPTDYNQVDLTKPIKKTSGFNIWNFSTRYVAGSPPQLHALAYINNVYNRKSQTFTDWPFKDREFPFFVGSRDDYKTALNGWVSEVLVFAGKPDFASFDPDNITKNSNDKVTDNMLGYYNISGQDNCLSFEASKNNYVEIGTKSSAPYIVGSSYTKEAWIYWRGNVNEVTSQYLISSNDEFGLFNGNLFVKNNKTGNHAMSTKAITENEWVHVAAVYDKSGKTVKLYINGEPVILDSPTSVEASGSGQVFLGILPGGQECFNGEMDEVRIWSMARKASDIKKDYNKIISSQSDLVVYYNFDEGTPSGNNSSVTSLPCKLSDCSTFNGTLRAFTLNGIISNWKKSEAVIVP